MTRDGRVRIYIHPDVKDVLQRRLEEEGMTLSEYIRHLIKVDTGGYIK